MGSLRPTDPQFRGAERGASFERLCPRDHAVKGFRGRFGSLVQRLEIICQPLGAGGRTAGPTRTLSALGQTGDADGGPYYCENQMPATALLIRGRSRVEGFGLACGYPTVGCGWFSFITTSNITEPVDSRLGPGADVIAGHNIRQIVTDPKVRVGPDRAACVTCHTGPGTAGNFRAAALSKSEFCALVHAFDAADKPQVLKNLFKDWRSRGCPD